MNPYHPDKDPLKKLISKNLLAQPSSEFTASVMEKLGIAAIPTGIKYEPVISRKGWIFTGILGILFLYLALSGSTNGSMTAGAVMLESGLRQSTSILQSALSGSGVLLLTMASVAGLLLAGAESWYRSTRLQGS